MNNIVIGLGVRDYSPGGVLSFRLVLIVSSGIGIVGNDFRAGHSSSVCVIFYFKSQTHYNRCLKKIKRRHSECITHSYMCIDRKLSRLLGFSQKIIGLLFFFYYPKIYYL